MTRWTIICQAPLLLGFPRQEYGGGLPFPSPEDLPNTGIEPESPTLQVVSGIAGGLRHCRWSALQADSLPTEPQGSPDEAGKPREAQMRLNMAQTWTKFFLW